MNTHWGFDMQDRDTNVRPQDDFYRYAGGGWLKRNPIPENEARWGTFNVLRLDTEHKLRAIVDDLMRTPRTKRGTPEQMIGNFFRSGMDMKTRNALKAKPLDGLRKKIHGITDTDDLLEVLADLSIAGVEVPFGASIDQDSKKSERYILHLYQSGLGMPERDYYLKDDAESVRVRTAYLLHIEGVLRLGGVGKKEATAAVATIMEIETRLARVSMSKEDRRDADKTYHKKTLRQLSELAPVFNWQRYFARIGGKDIREVIVMHPSFLTDATAMLGSIPLAEWKVYLEWHLLNEYAGYLSNAFVKHDFAFYGTVLAGTKVMKPLWRRSLATVNGALGELLGKIYVKRHFSAAAKRKMNELVDDLLEAYEARLKALDWMSPATKRKAVIKLRALNRKIGYPDRWKSYAGLAINPSEYVGNVIRTTEFVHRREMRKLSKPIDRGEWFMYPQVVNAYFAPNMNDIVFPAAILQPPFFNLEADDAVNYGSIGTVIGHEMTHGFDDQGSKYDAKGNLKSWWTPQDRKRFEKKAEQLRKQFDEYEVADGVKVNGKLTLGENIADLGGITIAHDAYQRRLKKTGRKDIDGLSPEQRFFLGVTLFDRSNTRPEYQKMAVLTDPHSPDEFRINGPMSNISEFYDAFKVSKGDALYRELKNRAKIW